MHTHQPASARLTLTPLTLRAANAYIAQHHRHHRPAQGALFAVGCSSATHLVGAATIGRPVSRHLDDGTTAEVTRLATDATPNACSMLYAAAWRAARSLGYTRLVTYILATEPGTSLRAASWREVAQCRGGTWSRQKRPRADNHPTAPKTRYERTA